MKPQRVFKSVWSIHSYNPIFPLNDEFVWDEKESLKITCIQICIESSKVPNEALIPLNLKSFELRWKLTKNGFHSLLENASKIKVLNINKQAILQWMNLKTFWLLAWHRNVGNAFTFSKKSQFYLKYNQEKR